MPGWSLGSCTSGKHPPLHFVCWQTLFLGCRLPGEGHEGVWSSPTWCTRHSLGEVRPALPACPMTSLGTTAPHPLPPSTCQLPSAEGGVSGGSVRPKGRHADTSECQGQPGLPAKCWLEPLALCTRGKGAPEKPLLARVHSHRRLQSSGSEAPAQLFSCSILFPSGSSGDL